MDFPFGKKKDQNDKKTQTKSIQDGFSTQEWLPYKDISGGFIHRRDGHLVKAVKIVEPINISLLSEKKRKETIQSLFEIYNTVDYPKQTISIPRPVDLDGYIEKLTQMKNNETNYIKKSLLQGYIQEAVNLSGSGEAIDLQFYILFSEKYEQKNDKRKKTSINAKDILNERAEFFVRELTAIGLTTVVCNDNDLRELQFLFLNPIQAAFERAPLSEGPYLEALYKEG